MNGKTKMSETFELPSGKTGIACATVEEMTKVSNDLVRRMGVTALSLGMNPDALLVEMVEGVADDEHAFFAFVYGPATNPTPVLFRVPMDAVLAHQAARAEQGVTHVH
jgi:hypothetical protein